MIIEEQQLCKDSVYAMWQRNFHDPAPYAKFYFDEVYGHNKILLNISKESILSATTLSEEEKKVEKFDDKVIKGMLHLNPYQLNIAGKTISSHYIVGVATDEMWRRQGVMRELLEEAFVRLRKQGEMFTYLMPADEAYYLPFDFQFGMEQMEQEMECFGKAPAPKETEAYRFSCQLPENLEMVCEIENKMRNQQFMIHTKITPEYLRRMVKETCSDFGKLIFVYKKNQYIGRFVLGAEDNYMVFSQVSCVEDSLKKEFLHQSLHYCEQEYHYGKYQLVLDESWEKILLQAGNYGGVRLLPVRRKKIIMFRLLNLEKMGPYLRTNRPYQCFVRIEDDHLKEQDGFYQWIATEKGSTIVKLPEEKIEHSLDFFNAGCLSIGELTKLIFEGEASVKSENWKGLTSRGKEMFSSLRPLRINCIQEFV